MNTSTIETSVIIIGAGPSGVGVSIYLSLAGIPHIIVDKEVFPRDKICGDAISGKSAHVLRKANPSWLHEVYQQPEKFTPSKGIIFVAPNGKPLYIPYGDHLKPGELAPGFTSQRLVFDEFLFSKIDRKFATVYEGAQVKSIDKNKDSVTVSIAVDGKETTLKAPVIVACDGDKSIVRKQFVNDNAAEKAYSVGLRAYYKNVSGLDPNGYIELHFLPEILPGYFWIFPLPNGRANVGVGIISDVLRKKKINLREQMMKAIENNPTISHRFANATLENKIQGWGLPMGMKQTSISGDRYLLCGDAARLIDPFSGEGIGNALYSGMLAAEAIARSQSTNDFSAANLYQEYDVPLYRRLGDEMRISATLQRLCRFPWLFNMVVNKANKSPSLSNMISGMFTNLDLREQLRKPSFYAKILLNK